MTNVKCVIQLNIIFLSSIFLLIACQPAANPISGM